MHYQRDRAGLLIDGPIRKQCGVEGCERVSKARDLCVTHYNRFRRGAIVDTPIRRAHGSYGFCRAPDCDLAAGSSGLCKMHYQDEYRGRGGAAIKRRGKVAFRLAPGEAGRWSVNKDGYVYRTRALHDGTRVREYAHRVAMAEALERPLLPHETPRHKNGVRHDNRISNLELWSTSQPYGQRVSDKVEWAKELLELYEPDSLA